MRLPRDAIAISKPFVFMACLLPLGLIGWDIWHETLGPDPVVRLEHRTGEWALRLLLATLTLTPLRRLTGWPKFIRYRRMLGLFAFFYATIHLTVYLVIDLGGFWTQIFSEIVKRPYITVGFLAWVLLLPLTATSTRGMMRRLGSRWQQLHRLVYLIALLGVLHFLWLVKSGQKIAVREPLVYLGVLIGLMLMRIRWPQLTRKEPSLESRQQ